MPPTQPEQDSEHLEKHDHALFCCYRGARLEKADKDNFTALLIAASSGHVQSLKTLIKLGGNVMVTDKNERTALHWAAEENQPEIMKV